MNNQTTQQILLTHEAFMASLEKTERMFREKTVETERMFKEQNAEYDRQRKENDRYLTEKFAETRQLMNENAERMKELQQTVGGWSNSHGFFAEEFFINSFKKGEKNFLGEKFDEFRDHVKPGFPKKGFDDEYDMMLINGKSVGIIEAKFKLRRSNIPHILRKAETFRENFPEYAHLKVYLGVAALTFDPIAKKECLKRGIAIIKQVGETVVIHDEHLKVF